MKNLIKVFIFSLIFPSFLFSQYFHNLKTTQSLGMGGTYLFNYYNTKSVLDNPALVANRSFEVSIIDFKLNMDVGISDVIDYINDHDQDFKNIEKYADDKENTLYKESIRRIKDDLLPYEGIEYRGQINPGLGVVFDGFGLNIYNTTTLELTPDVVFTPKFTVNAITDINIGLSIGQSFTKKLQLGASLKAKIRAKADELVLDVIKLSNKDFQETIKDTLTRPETGINVDIGAVYNFNKRMRFAGVLRNVPGTTVNDKKVHLDLGVEYDFWLVKAIFEVHDFFNTHGNSYLQNLHMGARMHLPFFKRISVSAGLNQGFPSAGVDINLWYVQLAYSYYQQAFSPENLTKDKTNFHSIDFRIFL